MNEMTIAFRKDVYHTAEGPLEMFCACNGVTPCLYHWYYEVKMDGAPTPPKQKEKMDEQFPGRKPQRSSGGGSGKQHRKVADAAVRPDGAENRSRPAKAVRGKGRRG